MVQDPGTTAKRIIYVFICEPPNPKEVNAKRKPNWYRNVTDPEGPQ
jgi:hypothetical protein